MTGTRFRRTAVVLGAVVAASVTLLGAPASATVAVAPSTLSAPAVRPAPPTPPRPVVPGHRALPAQSGTGRRIVYSERTPQHVWLVAADGTIVAEYAVSGRADWPRPGTYHVFSQSPVSSAPRLTFRWMTRFAHGRAASIGFHTIPRSVRTGRLTHPVSALGLPVGHGGCVHLTDAGAAYLYRWAWIGTTVVVLR